MRVEAGCVLLGFLDFLEAGQTVSASYRAVMSGPATLPCSLLSLHGVCLPLHLLPSCISPLSCTLGCNLLCSAPLLCTLVRCVHLLPDRRQLGCHVCRHACRCSALLAILHHAGDEAALGAIEVLACSDGHLDACEHLPGTLLGASTVLCSISNSKALNITSSQIRKLLAGC